MPTYNEAENLPRLHRRFRSANPAAGLLVVDDDSPDGTGSVADRIAAADPLVAVLHRTSTRGFAAAYREGMRWALEAGAEVVVQLDADGSHPPELLPRLLAPLSAGADVVIGSRYTDGGGILGWPWYRAVLSKTANRYARALLHLPVHDVTSGYRVWSRRALQLTSSSALSSQGYCFLVELTLLSVRCGLRVAEVPITFANREAGASKLSLSIALETAKRVTMWGLQASSCYAGQS